MRANSPECEGATGGADLPSSPPRGPRDAPAQRDEGASDMTLMPKITEEAIDDNLRTRYALDLIYTYSGTILIAVNPYKELGCYTKEHIQLYRGQTIGNLPPHVFALAEAAYSSLQYESKNQSIVISGESGAGKTETTKLILQYLCAAGSQATWAEQQILEANTVLEAFGNAKTVRNDNSSRFGKFVQVCIDKKGCIKGSILRDFLLERARITGPSPRETNYHVFYQLVEGAMCNIELCEILHLKPDVRFKYLHPDGDIFRPPSAATLAEQQRKLDALQLALTVLQVPPHMIEGLFKTLVAILWLGNLEFQDVDGEHSSLTVEDGEIVTAVTKLLGLRSDSAKRIFLERQINVRGNVTDIPLRLNEAREYRHAMSRALYARTFTWLVRHVNSCSIPEMDTGRTLGVLDIFGFENFNTNSLEQLCINYANEKLHMFFNHYVFQLEQELYKHEGIEYMPIEFTDNGSCLELLERPPKSLLKLLSEQCHMPKGSDGAYLNNVQAEFDDHVSFDKGCKRSWDSEFGVKHYAGSVMYSVKGFVDKNRDVQQDTFMDHLSRSTNPFVQEIADYAATHDHFSNHSSQDYTLASPSASGTTQRGTSKGRPTVVDTFRAQLQSLVDVLQATDVWYVRCIKPNSNKEAGQYNRELVKEQLRYLGMLEIVRIRRDGYPVHCVIGDFVARYKCILPKPKPLKPPVECDPSPEPTAEDKMSYAELNSIAKAVMHYIFAPCPDWQAGRTKIFMKSSVHGTLEAKRNVTLFWSSTLIQKWYRGRTWRRRYLIIRRSVVVLQAAWRAWQGRVRFLRTRRAAITIQRHLRGMFGREVAAALREMRRVEFEMKMRKERQAPTEEEMAAAANERAQIASVANMRLPSVESVDLDSLFDFLADVSGQQRGAPDGQSSNHQPTIAEIGDSMDRLVGDLDEELESVIQAELEDIAKQRGERPGVGSENKTNGHPPPPPEEPPMGSIIMESVEVAPQDTAQTQDANGNHTSQQIGFAHPIHQGQSTLPEPNGPPPPPPAFVLELNGIVAKQKPQINGPTSLEPIYESVIPRNDGPQPPGSNGNSSPDEDQSPSPPSSLPPPPVTPLEEKHESLPTNGLPDEMPLPDLPPSPPEENSNSAEEAPTLEPPNMYSNQMAIDLTPSPPLPPPPVPDHGTNNAMECDEQAELPPAPEELPSEKDVRRRGRVERRLQQMVTVETSTETQNGDLVESATVAPVNSEQNHDIAEFAKMYFNDHPRSPDGTIMATLTRKNKLMEAIPKKEMVTYYRGSTIPTSHLQLHDPESIAIACSIFRELCRYMRGEMTSDKEIQIIQTIIQRGLEREELRDEILIQCIRQVTDCPNGEWAERLWLLLCLVAVAWQPGRGLGRYYCTWLKNILKNTHPSTRPHQCAQWCLDNCRGAAPRALPPSTVEIAAMRRLGTIVCRFFFLDGRTKAIDVHPADTAAAAAARLADKLALGTAARTAGWAVYQQCGGREEHVRAHHYLYDVIASWELQQGPNGGSAENRFVFKRRLFRGTRELPQDPVEVALLYAQAVHSVVKLDEFPVSEKVALQLAGLQAQVALGEPSPPPVAPHTRNYYSEPLQFMPSRVAKGRPTQQWVNILAQAHRQYGAGRAELTAKALYLSCVMQYPLYGVTLFPVVYKGYWPHGSSVLLGVGSEGVALIRPADKVVLAEHRYSDIATLLLDPVDNCLTISLIHHGHHDGNRCIVLETTQKNEAAWLMAAYSPTLAPGLTEEAKRRAAPGTERTRLAQALRVARRGAIDSGVLRRPSATSASGFLRNTLRRLSRNRPDKAVQEQGNKKQGDTYKGFPPGWWSWSRTLPHSLTRLQESDENVATGIFKDIMAHAGFAPEKNGSGSDSETEKGSEKTNDDRILIAQTLLHKCVQKDAFLCELYMQLIKQTTEHPEPTSRVASRHWALLTTTVGVALPPGRPLRRLLLAHLRYHAIDHLGEEGRFARFAEQIAHGTASVPRRQSAPSREEVLCATARRPMHVRVLLLDGRQHGLLFGPAATADQLVAMLREKIGLSPTATGFALYEVYGDGHGGEGGGGERALGGNERAADVLARWERAGVTAGACRLVFKKRLFLGEKPLNAACPAERELLYHQILHALRHDRLPVERDEAVMLAALHAQAVGGDCAGGVEDCAVWARSVLPSRIPLPAAAVRLHHLALRGTTPAIAKTRALTLVQSCPLHRATIYDVMQSFTSNWPRALWLAVDARGLALLRRGSRLALVSYDHEQLLAVSPAPRALLLVTAAERKHSKVVLATDQAYQIATLIKEYTSSITTI